MRVAVVGLGAIGTWAAWRLSDAGYEVSALARGAVLEAVRRDGVRMAVAGEVRSRKVRVSDDPADLGHHDLVVVALKAPALSAAAPTIAALLGKHGVVLPAMNGVPWWFFHGLAGPYAGRALASVDPGGEIAAQVKADAILGCVVHASCSSPEPGLVVPKAGNTLIVGEPAGARTERLAAVAAVLERAGFEVQATTTIQQAIWYKLWGNMTMNPVSAITGATCDRVLDDPLVAGFVLQVMAEAAEVGARIGCPVTESGEARNAVTRKLGAFKTSMLQDVEAGRAIELDALLAAPREIAGWTGVATPAMDALFGLTRLFGRTRGLYPEAS